MCLTASTSHTGHGMDSRCKTPQLTCTPPVMAQLAPRETLISPGHESAATCVKSVPVGCANRVIDEDAESVPAILNAECASPSRTFPAPGGLAFSADKRIRFNRLRPLAKELALRESQTQEACCEHTTCGGQGSDCLQGRHETSAVNEVFAAQ